MEPQAGGLSLFTPVPTSDEVRRFLLTLYGRRHTGVSLRRANASIGEWRPQAHHCFQNVDEWMRHNPHHKRVDGFVYFDYRGWGLGFVRFVPHSVIEVEDGALVDITPHVASADYPFIRHVGTREGFLAIQEQQGTHVGLDLIIP